MRMRINKLVWRYLCLLIAAGICIGVFMMSSQDAEASKSTSGGLIAWFARRLYGGFSERSPEEQQAIVGAYQHFVRKLAHFSVYAALGIVSTGAALTWERPAKTCRVAAALVFCFCFAASDEIHQRFVPGRSGQVSDVLLDFCGAAVGATLLLFVLWLISRQKRKRLPSEEKCGTLD